VSAGHAHPLYLERQSPVHRLPPQVKVAAAVLAVVCVVATPREAFGVFAGYFAILGGVWVVARIPPKWLASRALIEAPFVVLAVLLPFAGGGERVELVGLSLSEPGLLSAWNILIKGTLGVLASLTLAATTPLRDLLLGLQRLRAPNLVITICTLMLRYLDVITGEARRMHLARISRGHDPRFIWQIGALARGIGTLFIRSYERGERVHLAMLSRGWTGTLPVTTDRAGSRLQWAAGLMPAALCLALAVTGWAVT
jgi:cobalt/nickel transport system permease protein